MSDELATIEMTGRAQLEWPVSSRSLIIVYQEQSSQMLELKDGQEIVVGRGPEVELCIDDSRISRRHTRLWREKDNVYVEDLGSTNGTLVNGVVIDDLRRIGPGDEVGVGSASLVLSFLGLSLGQRRLLTEGEFEDRLEGEVDRARRSRQPLSLAMLRLSGRSEMIRGYLVAMAPLLRRMDLLAAYGPREFAVLLPEAGRSAGQQTVQRLLAALEELARDQVALGVATYPVDAPDAGLLLEVARRRLRQARRGARAPAEEEPREAAETAGIVARSRQMSQVLKLARRIGGFDTTVLIMGETGTGKQVVAEEIHRSSPRKKGPLVHLNCGALPPSLLESELFGHERGAFTGADSRHLGHVEASFGGTLFLDEIGELPAQAQPKLLHLLEKKTFTRLGGTRPIQGDVRIIAATNRDLEAEVQAGNFREDLFFRLSAFVLHVSPLRERPEDIEPLALRFCAEFAASLEQPVPALSERALRSLKRYDWPGNVRQLRNAIERAVVLAEGDVVEEVHLPARILGAKLALAPAEEVHAPGARGPERDPGARLPEEGPLDHQLAQLEAQIIENVLRESNGNQSEAARRLGVTRRALIYRMKKYGLS